jgi:hypothetical protein
MKTLAKIAAGILGLLLLFLLYARLFGFNPVDGRPPIPGLWLRGELVNERITDWTFAESIPRNQSMLETRHASFPFLAHSVWTTRYHYKGRLYFGSGYAAGRVMPHARRWNVNVLANPNVRIGIGDKLYDVKLTYVEDGPEREELLRSLSPLFWSPGFYLHPWRVDPRD